MKKILLVETGIANIASVAAALRRLNVQIIFSSSFEKENLAAKILEAEYVVLPGVGSFGAGMTSLRTLGLVDAIVSRVNENKPLLAICLGMQLLFERSEESPAVAGLGIFKGCVTKLQTSEPLPHLSWNKVAAKSGFDGLGDGWCYFAHSYAVRNEPENSEFLTAEYGEDFIAAFRKNKLLACQFHPELSASYGNSILREWLL